MNYDLHDDVRIPLFLSHFFSFQDEMRCIVSFCMRKIGRPRILVYLRCSERSFLIGYSSPYYFCSTYVDSHERMITVEDFKVWIDCRHP